MALDLGADLFGPKSEPNGESPTQPSASKGFTFTSEDVEAAVDDLLTSARHHDTPDDEQAPGLPAPKPLEQRTKCIAIGVCGPKGCKTINSLGLKLSTTEGIPKPEGSICVVLHLDNQAPDCLDNFLCANPDVQLLEDKPFFIGLGDPVGRYKARLHRSDPACSAYVHRVIVRLLERLGERGDVGRLVFDGYGDYCDQFGGYYAAHHSGVASPLLLEGTQWYPRRELFEDVMKGGVRALAGGAFIVNGPSGRLDGDIKDMSKFKKRLKSEGLSEKVPPAKWLLYRENNANLHAIINTHGASSGGKNVWMGEVWEGRLARMGIQTGTVADLTKKNIGAFAEQYKKDTEEQA